MTQLLFVFGVAGQCIAGLFRQFGLGWYYGIRAYYSTALAVCLHPEVCAFLKPSFGSARLSTAAITDTVCTLV